MPQSLIKILSFFLSFSLILEQAIFAQTIDLSRYFARNPAQTIPQSDKFRPLHLRYISYDSKANDFKILLDKGDFFNQKTEKPKNEKTLELEKNTQELMKYFFIGLSLPNEKFWVNLRPDSPDNILDPDLEKTDIGRIFLEADLQLKKDTAGMTSPQTKEGREYWDKLYKKAGELFGTENITIPTITRPWIVPNEIIIREAQDNAYIYKATLKVMLEEDYLRGMKDEGRRTTINYSLNDPRLKELNEYSTQLIKETIIPKLTYEVNTSKRYAPLRQVYYSLILAQWFKARYREQLTVNSVQQTAQANNYLKLIDSENLTNLTASQPYDKQTYFQQYQQSFKDGEYNLQESVYTPMGQSIRRYVSGGMNWENLASSSVIPTTTKEFPRSSFVLPIEFRGGKIISNSLTSSSPGIDFKLHPLAGISEEVISKIMNGVMPVITEVERVYLEQERRYLEADIEWISGKLFGKGQKAYLDYGEVLSEQSRKLRLLGDFLDGKLLPFDSPVYSRAKNILVKILKANNIPANYPLLVYSGGIAFSDNNAWANDTYIGIDEGLLFSHPDFSALTDDELAFVFAHELAHCEKKHSKERIRQLAIYGQSGELSLSNKIILEDLFQKQEREADYQAQDSIVKAGFSAEKALSVLSNIEELCRMVKGMWFEKYHKENAPGNRKSSDGNEYYGKDTYHITKTHPDTKDRERELKDILEGKGWFAPLLELKYTPHMQEPKKYVLPELFLEPFNKDVFVLLKSRSSASSAVEHPRSPIGKVVNMLKEKNWYYNEMSPDERKILLKRINSLPDNFVSGIKTIAVNEMRKKGISVSPSSIASVLVYGSWCYGFNSQPTDMDVAVVVDGLNQEMTLPAIRMRGIDIPGDRRVDNLDIKVLPRYHSSDLRDMKRLISEVELWGHGILIYGDDLFARRPSDAALFAVAKRFVAWAMVYSQDKTAAGSDEIKARNWRKIFNRLNEAKLIFSVIQDEIYAAVSSEAYNKIDNLLGEMLQGNVRFENLPDRIITIDREMDIKNVSGSPISISAKSDVGGVDFAALPIQTESVASSALGVLPGGRAFVGDLDAEWARIQDVFNVGVRPSIQRLSEYTAAAAASPLAEDKINQVRVMLADILRRDEESERPAPAEGSCKQLLRALEAG